MGRKQLWEEVEKEERGVEREEEGIRREEGAEEGDVRRVYREARRLNPLLVAMAL